MNDDKVESEPKEHQQAEESDITDKEIEEEVVIKDEDAVDSVKEDMEIEEEQ
jgi:hypothetical protein